MKDVDQENVGMDTLLQSSLSDVKNMIGNNSIPVEDKIGKIIESQYYILVFIISEMQIQRKQREKTRVWWDRLQWVVIPMFLSGVAVFIWQALYFYFVVVPDFMKSTTIK